MYRQINGINIIHYKPTPVEQMLSRIEAMKVKEKLERKQKEQKCTKEQKENVKKIIEEISKSFNS